jgi:hypothetical protein
MEYQKYAGYFLPNDFNLVEKINIDAVVVSILRDKNQDLHSDIEACKKWT